ncbi:olfactory receptor 52P1-like [Lethenteron reissneri]|uniref:olfactory receptor 52P1-like n=1 Tax=Lethenteron reissneri TaxID=7753 RepID=UPI002AB7527F|nr:olfactory receptor 52P1-like [Lethenteron reissneri]
MDPSRNSSLAPPGAILIATLFREPPALRAAAFAAVLAIYAVTVTGNPLLAYAIHRDARLHKPMYVLMGCLAVADVAESTAVLPRIMRDLAWGGSIAMGECLAQMCFIHVSLRVQGYLLAAMAIDRCLAVCRPLAYRRLVTNARALGVAAALAAVSALLVAGNLALILRLPYRDPLVLLYPSCNFLVLSNLSYGDTSANSLYGLVTAVFTVFAPLCAVALAYVLILLECRRPALRGGRAKALRTCVTHLAVLVVFFASLLFNLASGLRLFAEMPRELRSPLLSLYQIVPPAINPVIYGLRTAEIRASLARIFRRRVEMVRPVDRVMVVGKE